jgi:periplasmic divalent cation tolerance protein
MKKDTDYQLLITTCPNSEIANKLAQTLLENHLAACINIIPHIQSVYEWEGKIVTDAEVLLLIKTRRERYVAIEQTLLEEHPYDVPELIVLPIETGLPSYLAWLDNVITH